MADRFAPALCATKDGGRLYVEETRPEGDYPGQLFLDIPRYAGVILTAEDEARLRAFLLSRLPAEDVKFIQAVAEDLGGSGAGLAASRLLAIFGVTRG